MQVFMVIFKEVREVQSHNGRTSVAELNLHRFRSRNGGGGGGGGSLWYTAAMIWKEQSVPLTSVYCSQGFNIILTYVKKFIGCCLWGFLTMVLVLLTIFL